MPSSDAGGSQTRQDGQHDRQPDAAPSHGSNDMLGFLGYFGRALDNGLSFAPAAGAFAPADDDVPGDGLTTLGELRQRLADLGHPDVSLADVLGDNGDGRDLLADLNPDFSMLSEAQRALFDPLTNAPLAGADPSLVAGALLDALSNHLVDRNGRLAEPAVAFSLNSLFAREQSARALDLRLSTDNNWSEEEYFLAARVIVEASYHRFLYDEYRDELHRDMARAIDDAAGEANGHGVHELAQAIGRLAQPSSNDAGRNSADDRAFIEAFIDATRLGRSGGQGDDERDGRSGNGSGDASDRKQNGEAVSLNSVRQELFERTKDPAVQPYGHDGKDAWQDFRDRNGLPQAVVEQLQAETNGEFERLDVIAGILAEAAADEQALGSTFAALAVEAHESRHGEDRHCETVVLEDAEAHLETALAAVVSRDVDNGEWLNDEVWAAIDILTALGRHGEHKAFGMDDHVDAGGEHGNVDPSASGDAAGGSHADGYAKADSSSGDGDEHSGSGKAGLVINGTDGDDVLVGTELADRIRGGLGNDQIAGAGGDDTLSGDEGTDTITGGEGEDTLIGGAGADSLYGGEGDDRLVVDALDTEVSGGEGYDTVVVVDVDEPGSQGIVIDLAAAGVEELYGSGQADTVTAADATESVIIAGNGGDDQLTGGQADDVISGGEGDDTIVGGAGDDRVFGGAGNDTLVVDSSDSEISGGEGYDKVIVADLVDASDEGIAIDLAEAQVEELQGSGQADRVTAADATGSVVIAGNGGDDELTGGQAADTISGGTGDDTIVGGAGADSIFGGAGDDTLVVDASDTTVSGGEGYDTVIVESAPDPAADGITIDLAAALVEELQGSEQADTVAAADATQSVVIAGNGGDDELTGGQAADTIFGGTGDDSIVAGAGDDQVAGGAGDDTILGGEGADQLAGGEGADTIAGGTGDDTIFGGSGNDAVVGGAGADTLVAGAGDDTVVGGEGADVVDAGAGDDTLIIDRADLETGSVDGGSGYDTARIQEDTGAAASDGIGITLDMAATGLEEVIGTSEADVITAVDVDVSVTIFGGAGDDVLVGSGQADTIQGGEGADQIQAGAGADTVDAGAGSDTITAGAGDDTIAAGAGDDTVQGGTGADTIAGDTGNDTIIGGAGADTMLGGEGDDLIFVDVGTDIVDGGAGIDTVQVADANGNETLTGVNLDISNANVEVAIGGGGNDVISASGSSGGVTIVGGGGDDTIIGSKRADTLAGDMEANVVFGGKGDDLFVFRAEFNHDTILDWQDGQDRLDFTAVGVDQLSDLTIVDVGNDVLITLVGDTENSVLVLNARANNFSSDDFVGMS